MNNILPTDATISKYTYELAEEYRQKFSNKIKNAHENGAVTISPDMCTDEHKQISYLGASATFVDEDFDFHSVDLFCQAYQEEDKSSERILLVLIIVLLTESLLDLRKCLVFI